MILLARRPMTCAEVARALRVDRAAAYRHLRTLVAAAFVVRQRRGPKWVYYSLTERARDAMARGGRDG